MQSTTSRPLPPHLCRSSSPAIRWPGIAAALAIGLLAVSCAGSPETPTGGARGGGALAGSADLAPPFRETLPNGLELIVQEHWAADVVAIYMWVASGVRDDAPDQLGYAHFQEHMLFKGTDEWGPGHIDRAVEGVGGRKNAVTSFDYRTFFMTLPADRLESGVQILAAMAFRSVFDPVDQWHPRHGPPHQCAAALVHGVLRAGRRRLRLRRPLLGADQAGDRVSG